MTYAPPPVPDPQTTAPPPGRGQPAATGRRRARWFVLAAVVGALLVAAGVAAGFTLADDNSSDSVVPAVDSGGVDTSTAPAGGDTGAAGGATDDPGTGTSTPQAPAPGAGTPSSPSSEEPAAAAAAAVLPTVVQIDVANTGTGSGIIYDDSGLIMTNAHVVDAAETVTVRLPSGVRVEGRVLGADLRTDVAVVQIDATEEFSVAVLAGLDTVEVGQIAVAIGSPFGLESTVTAGIVSAVNRVVGNNLNGVEQQVEMIQTDAPINPGNSGGALVDKEGRVIGMNTSIRTDGSEGNIGLGFAIPMDTARLIADRIVAGEPLESGFLGVTITAPVVGQPGALVTLVEPGTPADEAGLVIGDLIVAFDGEDVRSNNDLVAKVRLRVPGDTVEIVVMRDGAETTLTATLGTG
ncbi:MAG: trypsin-like peptidase domain-containing protein [Acidimicrobiales bacterium]